MFSHRSSSLDSRLYSNTTSRNYYSAIKEETKETKETSIVFSVPPESDPTREIIDEVLTYLTIRKRLDPPIPVEKFRNPRIEIRQYFERLEIKSSPITSPRVPLPLELFEIKGETKNERDKERESESKESKEKLINRTILQPFRKLKTDS